MNRKRPLREAIINRNNWACPTFKHPIIEYRTATARWATER